jgi:AcrR family transcriptional regulator
VSVLTTGRRNLKREDRREQILQAALRAFERGGYHGTHVSQIVAEAGVARGTFYLHFESKHAVFAALVDRMLAIFLETGPPEPRISVTDADTAHALLYSSFLTVLTTLRQHWRLCRLLLVEAAGIDKGFQDQLDEHYAAWHELIAAALRVFEAKGLTRPGLDVELTAEMVVGMVDRITRKHVLRPEEPDLVRLARELTEFELRGAGIR